MEISLYKRIRFYTWLQPKKAKESAVFLFLAAFLFLYLFKPFTVNESELKYPYILICLLHALSPALIVFAFFTLPLYFGKLKSDRNYPSVFQAISSFIILFFFIGVAGFLMRDLIYDNPDNWSLQIFSEEVRNAYLGGILFTAHFIFASFYFHTKQDQSVQAIPSVISQTPKTETQTKIFIQTHVRIDDFSFSPFDFLFARAEGNYVELTIRTEHGLKIELKRISLKNLELQLIDHLSFLRCHRAYLLNMQHIEQVSGNSQGYFISFNGVENKVPVSRANLEIFDERYQLFKK